MKAILLALLVFLADGAYAQIERESLDKQKTIDALRFRAEQEISSQLAAKIGPPSGSNYEWMVIKVNMQAEKVFAGRESVTKELSEMPGFAAPVGMSRADHYSWANRLNPSELIALVNAVSIEIGVSESQAQTRREDLSRIVKDHLAAIDQSNITIQFKSITDAAPIVPGEPKLEKADVNAEDPRASTTSDLITKLSGAVESLGGGLSQVIWYILLGILLCAALVAFTISFAVGKASRKLQAGVMELIAQLGNKTQSSPEPLHSGPSQHAGSQSVLLQSGDQSEQALAREIFKDSTLATSIGIHLVDAGRFDAVVLLLQLSHQTVRSSLEDHIERSGQKSALHAFVTSPEFAKVFDPVHRQAVVNELREVMAIAVVDRKGLIISQAKKAINHLSNSEIVRLLGELSPNALAAATRLLSPERLGWMIGSQSVSDSLLTLRSDVKNFKEDALNSLLQQVAQFKRKGSLVSDSAVAAVVSYLPLNHQSSEPEVAAQLERERRFLSDRAEHVAHAILEWTQADMMAFLGTLDDSTRSRISSFLPDLRRKQIQAGNYSYSARGAELKAFLSRGLNQHEEGGPVASLISEGQPTEEKDIIDAA